MWSRVSSVGDRPPCRQNICLLAVIYRGDGFGKRVV